MINLSGQKMSKSEGNIKLLNEYIDKFGGNVIRFFFLRSHYRKPQEFSEGLLEESKTTFKRIQDFTSSVEANPSDLSVIEIFKNSMNDDLNSPKFLGEIFEKINNLSNFDEDEEKNLKETIKFIFEVLGFNFDIQDSKKINHEDFSKFFNAFEIKYDNLEQAMEEFLTKREKFRSEKNFSQADLMRDKLKEIGLFIKDGDDSGWYWENS